MPWDCSPRRAERRHLAGRLGSVHTAFLDFHPCPNIDRKVLESATEAHHARMRLSSLVGIEATSLGMDQFHKPVFELEEEVT